MRVEAEFFYDAYASPADLDTEPFGTPEPVMRISRLAPEARKDRRHSELGKKPLRSGEKSLPPRFTPR